MAAVDVSAWQEFRVGDLFDAVRGKVGVLRNLNEGDMPVIAAAGYDQGVAGYYDVEGAYVNALTASCNGVGCGSVFYHPGEFNITGDALVLLEKFDMTECIGLFLESILHSCLTRKYSYAEKLSPDKIKGEVIKLPAALDGQPDWAYMEAYMRSVMERQAAVVDAFSRMATEKRPVDVGSWVEFRVGDLFDCNTTLSVVSKNDLVDGDINYVTRSAIDNGLSGTCGNEEQINVGNCITIGAEGFVAFWQKDDFVAGNKVYSIRHDCMNEQSGLFVCTALNTLSSQYSFSDARVLDRIKDEGIKLPATPDGEPDWAFMESYMWAVMERQEHVVEVLSRICNH